VAALVALALSGCSLGAQPATVPASGTVVTPAVVTTAPTTTVALTTSAPTGLADRSG
jgi:hypothetical protein